MTRLDLKDFIDCYNEFYDQYNSYITICSLIKKSNLGENEQETLLKSVKEKYDGYTNIYEIDVYTAVTDELLKTGFFKYTDPFEELIKHIGEECSVDNTSGILKNIVATIEDFYYIIEVDGKDTWFSAVAKIEFKNNEINKA